MTQREEESFSDYYARQKSRVYATLAVIAAMLGIVHLIGQNARNAERERRDRQLEIQASSEAQKPISEDELREMFIDAMVEEFAIEMERVEREFGRTYIPVRYPNGGWPQHVLVSSGQPKVIDCILVPTTASVRKTYWSATVEVEAFDDLDSEYRVRLVGVIDAGEPVNERREWEFGRRTMSFSYGRNKFDISTVIPKNLVEPIHRVEVVLEELEPLRR